MLSVEQPRHFCTLSAQQTVLAIKRAIPILHAGPGCSAKLFGGLSFNNGFQGSGYAGGNAVPCTNTGEKEVVFGGEARLRKVIEGTLKVMDGDMFVVLTGCTADIVGDDTGSVVGEFREAGVPIIYAETGGFKGSSYKGHELLLKSIIEQQLEPAEAITDNLVNVFSVVPYLDPLWNGNLEELKTLLTGLGLKVNIIFGENAEGIKSINDIPRAKFNLLVSNWVGLDTVKLLEEKFGTPYLHYPVLPIGANETSRFLRAVSEFAGIDKKAADEYIDRQESRYYYYFERAADFLLEFRYDLPGRFFNIADSFYALGISKFLINDIGMLPGHQFITDDLPEEFKEGIASEFAKLLPDFDVDVSFTTDGGLVQQELRAMEHRQPPLIIGSLWDKDIAKELGGYYLGINLPITERLILDRAYVGYRGGLRLLEDLYTAVLGSYQ